MDDASTANGTLVSPAPGRRPRTDPGGAPPAQPAPTPRDPTAGTFARDAVSIEEVEDILREYAERYGASAKAGVSLQDPATLRYAYVGTFPAVETSLEMLAARFGSGKYRIVVSGDNGNNRKGIAFVVAAPASSGNTTPVGGPASQPSPSVAPAAGAPDPSALLGGIMARLESLIASRLAGVPVAAPVAPTPPGFDLAGMMMESFKQQGNMVNMLIAKLVEKQSGPPESPKVTELEQILRFASKLNRSDRRDDDGDSLTDMVTAIVPALLQGVGQQAPRRVVRVIRPTAGAHAGGPAVRGAGAPPLPPSSTAPANTALPAHTAHTPGAGTGPTPQPGPTHSPAVAPDATPEPVRGEAGGDVRDSVAPLIREMPVAVALATIIKAADDDTDAESIADVAAGVLGEGGETLLANTQPGDFTREFLTAFPALEATADRVREVEDALRRLLADDADPETPTDPEDAPE